jgi:hypothetical protein
VLTRLEADEFVQLSPSAWAGIQRFFKPCDDFTAVLTVFAQTATFAAFAAGCPQLPGYKTDEGVNVDLHNIPDTCRAWSPHRDMLLVAAEECW